MDAPLPPASRIATPVLAGGIASTALALFGVHLLASGEAAFNPMGWYLNYVIPIGALLVGLVAASGYGIAAWFGGYRISRATLGAVLVLQLAAYGAAQYLEYRQVAAGIGGLGFFAYYDLVTRAIAFDDGGAWGAWGYVIRVLEVVGFVGGSLLIPLALKRRPFCDGCQRYKRQRALGHIPVSEPERRVKKSDAEGQAALAREQQRALQAGEARYNALLAAAREGPDVQAAAAELNGLKAEFPDAHKRPARIEVSVVRCPTCSEGHLAAAVVTGKGDRVRRDPLPDTPVPRELVEALG